MCNLECHRHWCKRAIRVSWISQVRSKWRHAVLYWRGSIHYWRLRRYTRSSHNRWQSLWAWTTGYVVRLIPVADGAEMAGDWSGLIAICRDCRERSSCCDNYPYVLFVSRSCSLLCLICPQHQVSPCSLTYICARLSPIMSVHATRGLKHSCEAFAILPLLLSIFGMYSRWPNGCKTPSEGLFRYLGYVQM